MINYNVRFAEKLVDLVVNFVIDVVVIWNDYPINLKFNWVDFNVSLI